MLGLSDSVNKSGVFGFNSQNTDIAFGVFGRCDSPAGAGVSGRNDNGDAVNGFSVNGNAVKGRSEKNDGVVGLSDSLNKSGVLGFNSQTSGGFAFGVFGRCDAPEGAGVSGRNDAENGDAVSGFSPNGYGGHFLGGRAPLRLAPASIVGPPTSGSHQRGEFFVDSSGDLFYCKIDGTPGTGFKFY